MIFRTRKSDSYELWAISCELLSTLTNPLPYPLYICASMKKFSSVLGVFVVLAVKMASLSSCANILPPSGGARDSLPPRLVAATPRDSAVNVRAKTITLVFDEYITLQNAFSNLVISPIPAADSAPQVDSKLRTVTIKFKDSLPPNTTYSFNFGNAIQDVNESNIARNFVYAFSTGPRLDNNTYRGKVIMAETGKPVDSSSLIVVLHRNLNDTAASKSNPRYYAVLNGKGEFTFNHLPDGKFAVYAVASRFNKRYADSTELFAFRSEPLEIVQGTTQVDTLYAYEEVKRNTARPSPGLRPNARNEDRRLRYTSESGLASQDLLGPVKLNFNRKLFVFDSTKFALYDTTYNPIKDYSVHLDSNHLRVTIEHEWKQGTDYRLLIAKEAVADSLGITLAKADTIRFTTRRESEYGSLHIRFENLDLSKNPVLQIVNNDGKMIDSAALTTPDFQRKLFAPGSYDMRILYDRNKNGKWDPGHFPGNKRQPEVVYLIQQNLVVRGNWDNFVKVIL